MPYHRAMTTRRCSLLFAPPVIAVLVAGAWLIWPRTAITRENAAKLHVGMTLEEVETILGGPARDESTGPCELDVSVFKHAEKEKVTGEAPLEKTQNRPSRGRRWLSDRVAIWVREAEDDQGWRIIEIDYIPRRRSEESVLDRVRRWLHL